MIQLVLKLISQTKGQRKFKILSISFCPFCILSTNTPLLPNQCWYNAAFIPHCLPTNIALGEGVCIFVPKKGKGVLNSYIFESDFLYYFYPRLYNMAKPNLTLFDLNSWLIRHNIYHKQLQCWKLHLCQDHLLPCKCISLHQHCQHWKLQGTSEHLENTVHWWWWVGRSCTNHDEQQEQHLNYTAILLLFFWRRRKGRSSWSWEDVLEEKGTGNLQWTYRWIHFDSMRNLLEGTLAMLWCLEHNMAWSLWCNVWETTAAMQIGHLHQQVALLLTRVGLKSLLDFLRKQSYVLFCCRKGIGSKNKLAYFFNKHNFVRFYV